MDPHDPRPSFSVKVRRAVPDDLQGMARVHVDGWKTAYRGIVSDEILDHLTVENDIARGFGRWFKEPNPGAGLFVAVAPGGEIVGYARGCANRDPDPNFAGELEAIYVLLTHRNRGVGTVLVREVTRFLESSGRTSMIVWVLAQNPYRRFYERLGGTLVGNRVGSSHRLGGGPLPEVGYGWKDIRRLASL
jgi:GNAT superfamily N-acetyltransferase